MTSSAGPERRGALLDRLEDSRGRHLIKSRTFKGELVKVFLKLLLYLFC